MPTSLAIKAISERALSFSCCFYLFVSVCAPAYLINKVGGRFFMRIAKRRYWERGASAPLRRLMWIAKLPF